MKKINILMMLSLMILLTSCVGLRTYKVSFDTKGGMPIDVIEVKATRIISKLPEPKKVGYEFQGWYLDDNYQVPFVKETYAVISHVKLYAKWSYAIIENINYTIENNILSWESIADKFYITIGNDEINSIEPSINLAAYALKLTNPTFVQVFENTQEKPILLLSLQLQATDLSIAYKADFKAWDAFFEGIGTKLSVVDQKEELWLVLNNPAEDVAYIVTKEKAVFKRIVLDMYSQHAVHDVKIAYSKDGKEFTDLKTEKLSQKVTSVSYELNLKEAVYIKIELAKDQRNQTANRYIAIKDMTFYGLNEGYEINEIKEDK